jgi:uncharacterized protein YndB with AHSA1/START domain
MTIGSDLGLLGTEGDHQTVRFERMLTARPENVWSALTEPEELGWLADSATFEGRLGGGVELRWDENVMRGKVLRWEPPSVLEYLWNEGPHDSVVRFELTPSEAGTRLVLDHRRLPADSAAGFGAGWHAHLDTLEARLGGGELDFWPRFGELRPRYVEAAAALR